MRFMNQNMRFIIINKSKYEFIRLILQNMNSLDICSASFVHIKLPVVHRSIKKVVFENKCFK